jgi:hypothetical protein
MEETNYDRKTIGIVEKSSAVASSAGSDTEALADPETTREKTNDVSGEEENEEMGLTYSKKTFLQKLAPWDPAKPKNLIFYRAKMELRFLRWPVIFYAGCVSVF